MNQVPNTELNRFKVDHLLLLVGTNPLPNAVAARLLTRLSGSTITLIYSAGTREVKEKLERWLQNQKLFHQNIFEVVPREIEESNPTSIIEGVRTQLHEVHEKHQGSTYKIGLHYTGGTKAMAVHTYRAVEQWTKEKECKVVFSYLDARRLCFVFDPEGIKSSQPEETVYVGSNEIKLTLVELLELHERKLIHAPVAAPMLGTIAQELALTLSNQQSLEIWKDWISKALRKQGRREGKEQWKSEADLAAVSLALPNSSAFASVRQTVQKEFQLADTILDLGRAKTTLHLRCLDICEWFDGKWLEHYVLAVLGGLQEQLHLHDCFHNVETKGIQFDMDVVAIRGYQLFAFSCTTISKGNSLLKSKLFEAFVRARQLGGDEARVALVCLCPDPMRVQQEIESDLLTEGRIRVFGATDLPDLPERIKDWIVEQSRGQS